MTSQVMLLPGGFTKKQSCLFAGGHKGVRDRWTKTTTSVSSQKQQKVARSRAAHRWSDGTMCELDLLYVVWMWDPAPTQEDDPSWQVTLTSQRQIEETRWCKSGPRSRSDSPAGSASGRTLHCYCCFSSTFPLNHFLISSFCFTLRLKTGFYSPNEYSGGRN